MDVVDKSERAQEKLQKNPYHKIRMSSIKDGDLSFSPTSTKK